MFWWQNKYLLHIFLLNNVETIKLIKWLRHIIKWNIYIESINKNIKNIRFPEHNTPKEEILRNYAWITLLIRRVIFERVLSPRFWEGNKFLILNRNI